MEYPWNLLIPLGFAAVGLAVVLLLRRHKAPEIQQQQNDQRADMVDAWLGTQGQFRLEGTTFVCKVCGETWPGDMISERDAEERATCIFCKPKQ